MVKMGQSVTILGGSGFVGSYVVKELAKTGACIKIVSRNNENAHHLRTCGAVGQISFVNADVRNEKSLEEVIQGSDAVVNLIGILFQKKKYTFEDAHVRIPKMAASLSAKHGVKSFVHISALAVDKSETSLYAQSKMRGEKEILNAFPKATILRPSVVFGAEDNFTNLFANIAKVSPFLPLIGGGQTKFQPVYVGDLAQAIAKSLSMNSKEVGGKIFELGGPKQYTFEEILKAILKASNKKRLLVNIPFMVAKLEAMLFELMPTPLLTRDQIELLKVDNVVTGNNGFTKLGIEPKLMEAVLPQYMVTHVKNT